MNTVLIHIGYPKAGSTFLQLYFSKHPNVYYDGNSLGNFKYTGELDIIEPNLDSTYTHFVISEEQLSVWQGNLDIVGIKFKEFDVKNHQKKTCEKLHEMFPDAKILIITRGFEGAIKSMFSQYISVGGILPFAAFVKEYSKNLAEFYNYDFLIGCYRNCFSKKNVVVIPFELLRQNASYFITLIQNMLELPNHNIVIEQANVSLDNAEVESYRKLSKFIYDTVKHLPYSLQKNIYGYYSYLLYKRKLSWTLKLLKNRAEDSHIEHEVLTLFYGKANLLAEETLFEPYRKEYLL